MVEWPYLEQVLNCLNFPEVFIKWVMVCIKTVYYTIIINGVPVAPFKARKGLRQGDPLSPFLFILAMEYLKRQLGTLKRKLDFNFHPKCARMSITHLGFADDLLLFYTGDFVSVQMLYNCFQIFSQASGLVANADKSSIYFGGVCKDDQNAILQALGFTKGELPFRYLGIPLSTKRTNVLQYKPLLDKILNKITSWTFSFLSYAGRLQFIKSVLFSIQIFWSQVFVLPKKVVQLIESLCRRFLWTSSVNSSKKALIAWERLCYPKAAGGLGLLDVHV